MMLNSSVSQVVNKLEKNPLCCVCGHQLDERTLFETKEYNKAGLPIGLSLHCPHCNTKVRITGKIWTEYGGKSTDEN